MYSLPRVMKPLGTRTSHLELMRTTDKAWEKWGATSPYYGVLTSAEYDSAQLTDDAKAVFFETGRQHVDHVSTVIGKHLSPDFTPRRVLDFGCGTGRVLIPLARLCDEVQGLDVSESMRKESVINCERAGLENVTVSASDDCLSALTGTYDLIHSFIVFQHIPRERGERLIEQLLEYLSEGGIAALHVTFDWEAGLLQRLAYFCRHHVPLAHPIMNLLRGRRASEPRMQMNLYNLNRLFRIMSRQGVSEFHAELVRHGAHQGVMLYMRKDAPRDVAVRSR